MFILAFLLLLLLPRNFSLSLSLPKSTVQYWSSVYQQRGLEFRVTSATCGMKYVLRLVPHNDELIRRPRADWTVASLQGEVTDILAYTCIKEENEVDSVSRHTTVT